MKCQRCGKWAGAHATLPGQPTDHLCMCFPLGVAVLPATTFNDWWSSKPSETLIGRDTARWIWDMVHNLNSTTPDVA